MNDATDQPDHDGGPAIEIDCIELHEVASTALDRHRLAAANALLSQALGVPVDCMCGYQGSLRRVQEHALHEMIHAVLDHLALKADLHHHDHLAHRDAQ